MNPVLKCEGVRSGYRDVVVLPKLSLEVKACDVYAVMGKNGAGKTTLLLTLLHLADTTSGSIRLFGEEVSLWPTHRIIAQGVACAPQENAFFQDLTVDENLRLGCLGLSTQAYQRGRERVTGMFPFIGSRFRQRAGTLSGGEQAMLKVARALLPEPRLILLDEVSEGLQPLSVKRVREVLARDHVQRGTTMIVVEQNLDFVAGFATRYGLMERGELTGEGQFSEPDALSKIAHHLTI